MKMRSRFMCIFLLPFLVMTASLTGIIFVNHRLDDESKLIAMREIIEGETIKSTQLKKHVKPTKSTFSQPWVFMAGPHYIWKLSKWINWAQIINIDSGQKIYANLIPFQPKLFGVWEALSCTGLDNGDAVVQNDHQLLEFDPRGRLISELYKYFDLRVPIIINSKRVGFSTQFGYSDSTDIEFSILGASSSKIFILMHEGGDEGEAKHKASILITDYNLKPLKRICFVHGSQAILSHYIPRYPWANGYGN